MGDDGDALNKAYIEVETLVSFSENHLRVADYRLVIL